MLSVVIPVKDLHDATEECVENLNTYALSPPDIIIVDNASDTPVSEAISNVKVVRNERNIGFWPSMLKGIEQAESDYVLLMHNDVFIWESEYDKRIIDEFILDDNLAAVGLFGGRGVDVQGGRGHPEGNMLGKKYGTPQAMHGALLTREHPAVVFDSLAICINKRMLHRVDPETIPPHHWTDRLLCLRLIRSGFHCLTVGIEFDHGGAFTSSTSSMNTFSEDWCRERGLALEGNWENTLYMYGQRLFAREFSELTNGHNQLWVDRDYKYYVR